jgi:hypothetical protein
MLMDVSLPRSSDSGLRQVFESGIEKLSDVTNKMVREHLGTERDWAPGLFEEWTGFRLVAAVRLEAWEEKVSAGTAPSLPTKDRVSIWKSDDAIELACGVTCYLPGLISRRDSGDLSRHAQRPNMRLPKTPPSGVSDDHWKFVLKGDRESIGLLETYDRDRLADAVRSHERAHAAQQREKGLRLFSNFPNMLFSSEYQRVLRALDLRGKSARDTTLPRHLVAWLLREHADLEWEHTGLALVILGLGFDWLPTKQERYLEEPELRTRLQKQARDGHRFVEERPELKELLSVVTSHVRNDRVPLKDPPLDSVRRWGLRRALSSYLRRNPDLVQEGVESAHLEDPSLEVLTPGELLHDSSLLFDQLDEVEFAELCADLVGEVVMEDDGVEVRFRDGTIIIVVPTF